MFKRTFVPRISEVNIARHIRADVIIVWLVEGSTEFRQMFSLGTQTESHTIMANINVDFINEMVGGKDVEVTTRVKSIGNSSFALEQNVYQDATLCATGIATFINYNYATHKSEFIPPSIRLKLEEHMIKASS